MEAFLCLAWYLCIYAYSYVLYTYGTAVPAPSVRRSTTRNTPWTRPAARHGTHLPRHGRPPGTIHPHLSRCSSGRSRNPAPVSSLSRPHYFFFISPLRPVSLLAILLFPHPPCYRVQGQPIEGNFLVPIASACPPRTIRFSFFFF